MSLVILRHEGSSPCSIISLIVKQKLLDNQGKDSSQKKFRMTEKGLSKFSFMWWHKGRSSPSVGETCHGLPQWHCNPCE